MSAYATLADFKQRLGSQVAPPGLYEQLTDRLKATTANDTVGQAVLDAAEAIVNQKLAGRYAVPVDNTDVTLAAWLKHASLVIATWLGWSEHPIRSRKKDTVQGDYDEIMKTLNAIADGDQSLPGSSTPAAKGGITAKRGGDDRKLGMDIY